MGEYDMVSRYKKAIELWRNNDVENESTEVSLVAHPSMSKEVLDHQAVVLFTK